MKGAQGPTAMVSRAGEVGQPGRRPLISQICLTVADGIEVAHPGKWAARKLKWRKVRQHREQDTHAGLGERQG